MGEVWEVYENGAEIQGAAYSKRLKAGNFAIKWATMRTKMIGDTAARERTYDELLESDPNLIREITIRVGDDELYRIEVRKAGS